jgi:hypothetical protein
MNVSLFMKRGVFGYRPRAFMAPTAVIKWIMWDGWCDGERGQRERHINKTAVSPVPLDSSGLAAGWDLSSYSVHPHSQLTTVCLSLSAAAVSIQSN